MYHKAFEKARQSRVERTVTDQEMSMPSSLTTTRRGTRKSKAENPMLVVDIHGYNLTCAMRSDNGRKMSFMVNAEAVRFIQDFFVKILRHVILGVRREGSGSEGEDAFKIAPSPLAKFHFDQSDTPNIKDKVVWTVSARAWRASASPQCKGPLVHHDLPVDATLPPEAFLKAKCQKYWEAVRWWNRTDNSKRHKIPLPVSVEG